MSLSKLKFQSKGSQRKMWSMESMQAAIKSVECGMGVREASRLYNIPCETLRRRVQGVVSLHCRPGPPTVLTEEEEEALARYCVDMAEMGFGLSREDVMITAFAIADHSGRKHPFKDGIAGRSWYDGFKARHPRLTLRSAQPLSCSRAASANDATIQDFFGKLAAISARLNILLKPMQIYNVDETGVSIVHKPGKVITEIGRKNVWSVSSAEKGKTHTILTCVSVSGVALPPFMIYPRKKMSDHLKTGAVPGTAFHCSDSGWITKELYLTWFKFFLANIPPTRPILLIEDGHASHVTIEVIEMARSNGVHMICLPSHTTHLLQPLDVGVFRSLKANFSKACRRYLAANTGRVITTDVIASLIGEAWPLSITPVNIMSGFRKSGIYPLNPGQITDRQMAPAKAWSVVEESPKSEDSSLSSPCGSTTTHASNPQESLFQKRYEEKYDLADPEYISWLRQHHPESIPLEHRSVALTPASRSPAACNSDSHSSSGILQEYSSKSGSDTTHLSKILVLPKAKIPKRKKRPALTSTAQCITDTDFLAILKDKEEEKMEKKKEKELRKIERERKKKEKEKRKTLRKQKKELQEIKRKKESVRESETGEDTESEAECPKCGLVYGTDNSLWICCDSCGTWLDLKCTGISSRRNIPEYFICENCDQL